MHESLNWHEALSPSCLPRTLKSRQMKIKYSDITMFLWRLVYADLLVQVGVKLLARWLLMAMTQHVKTFHKLNIILVEKRFEYEPKK